MGCSLVKSTFLVHCVIKRIVDHAPRLPLCQNASVRVVTTSEKGNQFMLAVFSESVVHRINAPFNKNKVTAL